MNDVEVFKNQVIAILIGAAGFVLVLYMLFEIFVLQPQTRKLNEQRRAFMNQLIKDISTDDETSPDSSTED